MNTYISASAWPSHLLCPSLNHKKGVTFHIIKARPHHLVRTFLLELCFLDFDRPCSGPWTEWKFGEWTFWVSN